MNTIESNKLIAEFMSEQPKSILGQGKIYKDYSKSWDWLMPVAEKCLTIEEPIKGLHHCINDALLTCNIAEVYSRAMEFIKEYNELNK